KVKTASRREASAPPLGTDLTFFNIEDAQICHDSHDKKRRTSLANGVPRKMKHYVQKCSTTPPGLVKGPWTPEEDATVVQLVAAHGQKKWSFIARQVQGCLGKQCRERWYNHLSPDIKKGGLREEEDAIIIQCHAKCGNKWAEISKSLQGRTDNAIKNSWRQSIMQIDNGIGVDVAAAALSGLASSTTFQASMTSSPQLSPNAGSCSFVSPSPKNCFGSHHLESTPLKSIPQLSLTDDCSCDRLVPLLGCDISSSNSNGCPSELEGTRKLSPYQSRASLREATLLIDLTKSMTPSATRESRKI
ncbi:hypothetical protein HJC23_005775, partial [Cyclotella cryptica]